MTDSKIEWTDKTWNPVRGCTIISPGCTNCYAMKQAHRFHGESQPYEGLTVLTSQGPKWTGKIHLAEHKLLEPLRWKKPCRIFVNSMSDLFHEDVPFDYIDKVFAVMALTPRHTYQILTKRPARMLEYLGTKGAFPDEVGTVEEDRIEAWGSAAGTLLDGEWIWNKGKRFRPQIEHFIAASLGLDENGDMLSEDEIPFPLRNVWLGVSVENQKYADDRMPLLLQTPAAVRWVSYEPALGPVDFTKWLYCHSTAEWVKAIDWVVCGGESGPGARPMHPDWARSVRDQCQAAGVPFFFKQHGDWAPLPTPFYYEPAFGSGNRQYVRALKRYAESWRSVEGGLAMGHVGKKAAGRLLDGREWNEYPA